MQTLHNKSVPVSTAEHPVPLKLAETTITAQEACLRIWHPANCRTSCGLRMHDPPIRFAVAARQTGLRMEGIRPGLHRPTVVGEPHVGLAPRSGLIAGAQAANFPIHCST